jgi:Mrp family chromosome partitioning ATPase
MDALSDESIDVESLVVRTDVEGLYILPAGRFEEDSATELLSSAHMKRIVARLASRVPRRLALFDSPPLLLTTEAHVLTTLVGQIVLVVRAGVTPQQALFDAISTIGEDKPIGVVLNQSVGHPSAGYGSYGGYGAYGAYGNYGTYGTYDAPVGGSPETPPDPATRVDRS